MASINKQLVLTHVVKDVSSVPTSVCYGPTVEYANVPWRICFHKDGQNLLVFLECGKLGTDQWSIATNINSKILSVNGKVLISDDEEFTFGVNSAYGGYTDFLWEDIVKYEMDKELIIETTVTIGMRTGIEQPELLKDFSGPSAFTDVAFKVGEKKFFVSKVYMATQSENFKALFFGEFEEANKDEVELKETDPEAFQLFLELMYMEDTLTDSNIEAVLVLVDKFVAKNPARLCEEFLINKSDHCTRTMLKIAGQYNFQTLKDFCLDNLECRADIRAVLGESTTEMDPSICAALLEKSLGLP